MPRQLAELDEAAGALAFGAVAPAPPRRLRDAILSAAAAERTNVIPLPQRRWTPRVLAVAAAAACVAVGFGISALTSGAKQVVTAAVVITSNRTATLNVSGLASAPQGKTYEAWIIPSPGTAWPAGTFTGGSTGGEVALTEKLPPHATVAVTLERAGGVQVPTTTPIVEARTSAL